MLPNLANGATPNATPNTAPNAMPTVPVEQATRPNMPEMLVPKMGERMATISIPGITPEYTGLYVGTGIAVLESTRHLIPGTIYPESTIGFDPRSDAPGSVGEYGGKAVLFAHRTHQTPVGIDKPGQLAYRIPPAGMHLNALFTDPNSAVAAEPKLLTLSFTDKNGQPQTQVWQLAKNPEVYSETDPKLADVLGPGDGNPSLVLFACSNPDGSYGIDDPTPAIVFASRPKAYAPTHRIVTEWVPYFPQAA